MEETQQPIVVKNANLGVSSFRTFQEIIMFNGGIEIDNDDFAQPDRILLAANSDNIQNHYILYSLVRQKSFPFSVLFVCADADECNQWESILQYAFMGLDEREKDDILSYFHIIELERVISQYPLNQEISNFSRLELILLSLLLSKETQTYQFKQAIRNNLPEKCLTTLYEFGFVGAPLAVETATDEDSIYTMEYEVVVSCGPSPASLISVFALNAICHKKLWLTPPPIDLQDNQMKAMWVLLMHLSTREHSHFYIKNFSSDLMLLNILKTYKVDDIQGIETLNTAVIIERPVSETPTSASSSSNEGEPVKRRRAIAPHTLSRVRQFKTFVVGSFLRVPGYVNIHLNFTEDYKPLYQGHSCEDTNVEVLVLNSSTAYSEQKVFIVHQLMKLQPAENLIIFDLFSQVRASLSSTTFKVVSSRDYTEYFGKKIWKNHRYMIPFPEDLKHLPSTWFNMFEFLNEAMSVTFLSYTNEYEEAYLLRNLNPKLIHFYPHLSKFQEKHQQLYLLQHSPYLMSLYSNKMYTHAPIEKDLIVYSLNDYHYFITAQSFGVHLMTSFFKSLEARMIKNSRKVYEKYHNFTKMKKDEYISIITKYSFNIEAERNITDTGNRGLKRIRDLQYYSLRFLFSKKAGQQMVMREGANQPIFSDFPMTHAEYFRKYRPKPFRMPTMAISQTIQEIENPQIVNPFPSVDIPRSKTKKICSFKLNPKMTLITWVCALANAYFEAETPPIERYAMWSSTISPKILSMMVLVKVMNPFQSKLWLSKDYQEGLLLAKKGLNYVVVGLRGKFGLLSLQKYIHRVLRKRKRMGFACFPQKYLEFFKKDLHRFSFQIETHFSNSFYLRYIEGRIAILIKEYENGPKTITNTCSSHVEYNYQDNTTLSN